MPVGCKIQHTVGAAIRETLVARRIDLVTEVLKRPHLLLQVDAPQVLATLPTGHIARKIQISTVGRDSRVAVGRQRVGCNFHLHRLAPLRIAALRGVNLHRRSGIKFPPCLGKVHGRPVGCERRYPFVKLGVHPPLGRLGTLPIAVFIFLREEYVTLLGSRDFALGFAGGIFG